MKLRQILIVLGVVGILAGSLGANQFLSSFKEEPKKEVVPPSKKYVQTTQVMYAPVETAIIAYGRVNSSLPLTII